MADVTKITLLEDRVLVRAKGIEQKTASGIIIPDTATSEKPEQGEILSVGPGLVNEDGTVRPLTVKVGQMVLFTKYSPHSLFPEFAAPVTKIMLEFSIKFWIF